MKITKDTTTEEVTYQELARRVGDMVLANSLRANTEVDGDEWELVNGIDDPCYEHETHEECEENEHSDCKYENIDIYQEYIITDRGADYLKDNTDEIVYYNGTLDIYLWCITHYGTSWDYVTTSIKA